MYFKQLIVMTFIFGKSLLSLFFYTDNPYFFTTFSTLLSLPFPYFFVDGHLKACKWHMQQLYFLGPPPPGALGRGQRSNIIQSQLLSQFQIFLNQTLCVFSQMKDIKHIKQDFHWVLWVMPKGLGVLGGGGGGGGSKI